MALSLNRLSAKRVQALAEPGYHADGGGLYLVVDDSGAKRWTFRFSLNGKRREMGLGSAIAVSLQQARERAQAAREDIAEGRDPIAAKKAPVRSVPTFGEVAAQFMAEREGLWRNPIHRKQWRFTLETLGASVWALPVDRVDTDAVLKVLRPMWSAKPETAMRTRGRIERVLDAARVAGFRDGENPARWRGHLALILPKPKKLVRGHHASMPWRDIPAFMARLWARDAVAARALAFTILTAARSGEVRHMRWDEVDLTRKVWTVPASRMKAGRVHRVPLSAEAMTVLAVQRDLTADDLVFPSVRKQQPMSDMVFAAVLKRLKADAYTTHGFRSSFRDWVSDETDYPRELAEAALAHLVGDETERAYRRGDALEKRRALMDEWSAFCVSSLGRPAR